MPPAGEQYADIREPPPCWFVNAYGRRKADRAHINTHFFKAAIDARSLAITLHQPKALEAINAFMKGMTDPESSAPGRQGQRRSIQGRACKLRQVYGHPRTAITRSTVKPA